MTSRLHSDDDLIGLLHASATRSDPLDLDVHALARTAMRRGRTRRAIQAGGGVLAAAAVAGGAWFYGASAAPPPPADPRPSTSPVPDGRPTAGPFADDPTMARLPLLAGVRPGLVPEGWSPQEVSGLRFAVPDGWHEAPRGQQPEMSPQSLLYSDIWGQRETVRLTGPDGATVIAAESAVVENFSPKTPPHGYALVGTSRALFPMDGSDLAVLSLQGRFYDGMALDSAEILLRAAGGRGYVVVASGLDATDDPDTLVRLLGTLTFTDEARSRTPLTEVPLWKEADVPEQWQTLRMGSVTVSVPAHWSVHGRAAYAPTDEYVAIEGIQPREAMTVDQAQHRLETPGAEAILVRSAPHDGGPSFDPPRLSSQVDVWLMSGRIVTINIDLVDDDDSALLRQIAGTVRVDP